MQRTLFAGYHATSLTGGRLRAFRMRARPLPRDVAGAQSCQRESRAAGVQGEGRAAHNVLARKGLGWTFRTAVGGWYMVSPSARRGRSCASGLLEMCSAIGSGRYRIVQVW
jgi:hypothetical protein